MKSNPDSPPTSSSPARELSLSGPDLLGLMRLVLDRGYPFRFCAKGSSMCPFIRDGDVISIAPMDKKGPRLGEIVALCYPESDQMVVHRVIGKTKSGYLVQGDNLPHQPDGVFPWQSLLGKLIRVERGGRTIWLGIGPERFLIAFFSKLGIFPLLYQAKKLLFRKSKSGG